MADGNYLRILPVFIEGTALEQVTSIEVNHEANPLKIVTILNGLVGKSDGPKEVNISCSCAIPIGGPEWDFWNTCNDGTWVSIQVGCGDKDFVGSGWFTKVKISASSDKAAEVSFDWNGKAGKME